MILTDLVRTEVCARNWASVDQSLVPELERVRDQRTEYTQEQRAAILDRLRKIDQNAHPNFLIRIFRKIFYQERSGRSNALQAVRGLIPELQKLQTNSHRTRTFQVTQVNPPTGFARFKRLWIGRGDERWANEHLIEIGNLEVFVQRLTNGSMDPNELDGVNPYICHAVRFKNVEFVKALLAAGADVNQQDNEGYTALACACKEGQADMVKLLLDNGASVKGELGYHALILVVEQNRVDLIRLLLAAGASPHGFDTRLTHISHAAIHRMGESIEAFLAAGADVNQRDDSGDTALVHACRMGRVDMVKLLLDNGASVENEIGYRALCHVSSVRDWGQNIEIIRLLLAAGASPNGFDVNNMSPLMYAGQSGSMEIVKALVEGGADVNLESSRRRLAAFFMFDTCSTPLSHAVDSGKVEVVRYFLDQGARIDGWRGTQALDGAIRRNDSSVIEELFLRGGRTKEKAGVWGDLSQATVEEGTAPLVAIKNGWSRATREMLRLTTNPSWKDHPVIAEKFASIAQQDPELATLLLRLGVSTEGLGLSQAEFAQLTRWGPAPTVKGLDLSSTLLKVRCADGVEVDCNPDLLRGEFAVFESMLEDWREGEELRLNIPSLVLNKVLRDIQGLEKLNTDDLRNRDIALFLHQYQSRSFKILGMDRLGRLPKDILIVCDIRM